MNNIGHCKFCDLSDTIEVGQMYCKSCQVKYFFDFINKECVAIVFHFNDPKYFCLLSDMESNSTEVWFGPAKSRARFIIPQIFSDFKPENALSLAKRLHKLLIFS